MKTGWKVVVGSLLVLLVISAGFGWGQSNYPNRSIELVIPYPPGGGSDISTAFFKERVSKLLGQPLVANYKQGAGGALGTVAVARSKPDGYTFLVGTHQNLVILPLMKDVGYTLNDFVPVCSFSETRLVWTVKDDSPYKTMQDFINAGKTKKMKVGNTGAMNAAAVIMEDLSKITGAQFINIPINGTAFVQSNVMGGHVDIGVSGGAAGMVGPGKNRILAVNGETRFELFPDVPTLKEMGYPVGHGIIHYALWAPKGTPKEIVNKVYEIHKKIADENREEINKIFKEAELVLRILNPEQLGKVYQVEHDYFAKKIKELDMLKKQ